MEEKKEKKTHNGNSLAMSIAKTQTVASKYHAPLKGTVWRDDSILAKAIYKTRLAYLAVPERKETMKNNEVVSKGLRTNLKGSSLA